MTGDHAREWTSVPRRSRRDDGACPIPPIGRPPPCARANFGFSAFAESTRRGTHLLGLLGATLGAMVAELRTAVGRGTLGDVWRSERRPGTSGRRFSQSDVNRGIVPPGPLLELREIRAKMNSAAPCQGSVSSRARHFNQPRAIAHARVMRGDGTARRSRHASPRLARGAASPAGARAASRLEGPMTVRRARSRQRTAPSARWTPCSACPATKTTRPPRRNRTVSSRTRTAKSRRAIPPKPTR